ncbi:MAG: ribonuclease J [Firmicutes bacterium]|nr:ribonuclease J [Bacillota bacterium]
MGKKKNRLRVIPLGGLGEIGKNMTVIEYGNDIIIIDAGLAFPDDELLGIDLVIPDFTYVLENKDKVRAIFLTHGHEDHIGALPYLLQHLDVPVYGPRLALGLVEGKLAELASSLKPELREVTPQQRVTAGCFKLEFIRVNHSIADAVALAIETPIGYIVHSGDFKFDQTPIDGEVTQFHRFAYYGDKGVLLLLSDSTNAERPGYTLSEREVGKSLDETFRTARQRIIVATFASNIHRVQQILDMAEKYGRKVAVVGRSMVNVFNIARDLGYLRVPKGLEMDLNKIDNIPPERQVIISTGSQGEPMSALSRMANNDHRKVSIVSGDTVVISAIPIPGNEKLVARTVNHLYELGANVIYESSSGIHVSGHASQEELKMMLNLVRPKYFVPVHGESRHLYKHAELAELVGIPRKNIFVLKNGQVLEIDKESAKITTKVATGQVLVDGLGVGDVGNVVLRDRRVLSQDGILIVVVTTDKESGKIVAGPDIISRGFVYVRESEALLEEAREKVKKALESFNEEELKEWSVLKRRTKEVLDSFLWERTKRRPMIMPIITEV